MKTILILWLSILFLASSAFGNWEVKTSGTTDDIKSVLYDGNKYVAVGLSGVVVTSVDGKAWDLNTSSSQDLYGIAFDGTNYVGVGFSGAIVTSSDLLTWTTQTSASQNTFNGINSNGSLFIAIGAGADLYTSSDTINWTLQTVSTSNGQDVTNNGSIFVAVDSNGNIATSSDATNWSTQAVGTAFYAVTYGNGKFVAVGSGNIFTSTDGTTWLDTGYTVPTTMYGVAYNGTKYMAVGLNGTIITSLDGLNWNTVVSNTTNTLIDITTDGEQFIAVGNTGTILEWQEIVLPLSADLIYNDPITFSEGSYDLAGYSLTLNSGLEIDANDFITFTAGDLIVNGNINATIDRTSSYGEFDIYSTLSISGNFNSTMGVSDNYLYFYEYTSIGGELNSTFLGNDNYFNIDKDMNVTNDFIMNFEGADNYFYVDNAPTINIGGNFIVNTTNTTYNYYTFNDYTITNINQNIIATLDGADNYLMFDKYTVNNINNDIILNFTGNTNTFELGQGSINNIGGNIILNSTGNNAYIYFEDDAITNIGGDLNISVPEMYNYVYFGSDMNISGKVNIDMPYLDEWSGVQFRDSLSVIQQDFNISILGTDSDIVIETSNILFKQNFDAEIDFISIDESNITIEGDFHAYSADIAIYNGSIVYIQGDLYLNNNSFISIDTFSGSNLIVTGNIIYDATSTFYSYIKILPTGISPSTDTLEISATMREINSTNETINFNIQAYTNPSINNYYLPIYNRGGTFELYLDLNLSGVVNRWYYNFDDSTLYETSDGSSSFYTVVDEADHNYFLDFSQVANNLTINLQNVTLADHNITNIQVIGVDENTENFNFPDLISGNISDGYNSYTAPVENPDQNFSIRVDLQDGTQWWMNFSDNKLYQVNDGSSDFITLISSVYHTFVFDMDSSNFHNSTINIEHIYDHFREIGFSEFSDININFNVSSTIGNTLTMSITLDTQDIIDANITGSGSDFQATITVTSITYAAGITKVTVRATDGTTGDLAEKVFYVVVGLESPVLSKKENAINTDTFTGNLYSFDAYMDYLDKMFNITISEFIVNQDEIIDYSEFTDTNGIIYPLTDLEAPPTSILFSDTNITYTDLNGAYFDSGFFTSFTDGSTGTKVYITNTQDKLELYDKVLSPTGGNYSSLSDFMHDQVEGRTTHGLLRTYDKYIFFLIDDTNLDNDIIARTGTLYEYNEAGEKDTTPYNWNITATSFGDMLMIDTDPIPDIGGYEQYDEAAVFLVHDGYVHSARYIPANTTYSYILLNKFARDEIYNRYSPFPKLLAVELTAGDYKYISLSSSRSLCSSSVPSISEYSAICDTDDNTLESVFGSNIVLKYEEAWQYWDATPGVNPSYGINKFSLISPLDGVLVFPTRSGYIYLPYDENAEQVNDYAGMHSGEWYLLSNNKNQTISEIESLVTAQGKVIEYILMYKDNSTWNIYTPSHNLEIDPNIPRISEIKKYQSYWIVFQ